MDTPRRCSFHHEKKKPTRVGSNGFSQMLLNLASIEHQ